MINPTNSDIGRAIVYNQDHEDGLITSINSSYVFVRYKSSNTSQATRREDLDWLSGTDEGKKCLNCGEVVPECMSMCDDCSGANDIYEEDIKQ